MGNCIFGKCNCTEWLQYDLECYKVTGIPHIFHLSPESQISLCFAIFFPFSRYYWCYCFPHNAEFELCEQKIIKNNKKNQSFKPQKSQIKVSLRGNFRTSAKTFVCNLQEGRFSLLLDLVLTKTKGPLQLKFWSPIRQFLGTIQKKFRSLKAFSCRL